MKGRVKRQGAVSDFSIFRILVWLQVCARSEGCWEGQLEEGGGAVWLTRWVTDPVISTEKRPRSSPPPLLSAPLSASFPFSFLLPLTQVASEGRWHGESLHGGCHILLVNLSSGGKTACNLQTRYLQSERDRLPTWVTESVVEGPGGKRKLEKSGVQVIPGREGASDSVFSPVVVCLGHWLLRERREHRVQRCPSNWGQLSLNLLYWER